MTVTHHLSLDIQIGDGKNWLEVWNELNNLAQTLGKYHPNVAVTSTLLEDPADEFLDNYNMTVENAAFEAREKLVQETYTEDTMFKVREALAASTPLNTEKINHAIDTMQNAGILFRERVR